MISYLYYNSHCITCPLCCLDKFSEKCGDGHSVLSRLYIHETLHYANQDLKFKLRTLNCMIYSLVSVQKFKKIVQLERL